MPQMGLLEELPTAGGLLPTFPKLINTILKHVLKPLPRVSTKPGQAQCWNPSDGMSFPTEGRALPDGEMFPSTG